ncbi:hypothetical protein HY642_06990 [Candidatus Woesearchaeota archaeon]|nr:hypothetical protein [Candidatus Woesearchaeota archaeon]
MRWVRMIHAKTITKMLRHLEIEPYVLDNHTKAVHLATQEHCGTLVAALFDSLNVHTRVPERLEKTRLDKWLIDSLYNPSRHAGWIRDKNAVEAHYLIGDLERAEIEEYLINNDIAWLHVRYPEDLNHLAELLSKQTVREPQEHGQPPEIALSYKGWRVYSVIPDRKSESRIIRFGHGPAL